MWNARNMLFWALFGALPSNLQAAGRIAAEVETKPTAALSAEESRALSLSAAEILKQVNQARLAIGKKDNKEAARRVAQGLILVRIVNEALPGFKVETRITAGQLAYADTDEAKPLVVPVYEELQRVAVMSPVEAAKKEAAKSGVPVAVDVELVHTRTDLNVALAQAGLEEAKAALEKGSPQAADAALAAVQTGVIFGYAKMDLPLEKVRENLMLAKSFIDAGKAKEARAALDAVGDALEDYEKGAGTSRAKESKALRAELKRLAQRVESDDKGASETIMASWDKVRKWFN